MDDEQTRRRIRAARVLAGITIEELAGRIDLPGLGGATLGAIERGERPIQRHELREIADACGLPVAFFSIDFTRLAELEAALERHVEAAIVPHRTEQEEAQLETASRLSEIDQKLDQLLAQTVEQLVEEGERESDQLERDSESSPEPGESKDPPARPSRLRRAQ